MRDEGLGAWPVRRARMSPGRTAFVHDGQSISYAEFAERTASVAAYLAGRGVSAGDRVAYLGPNHPSFAEAMFATHSLGAIFVPLNFRLTAPELAYVLADSGAKLLLHAPEYAEVAAGLDVDAVSSFHDTPTAIDTEVRPGDIALILYTSGTTGRPKGAMLSHANLIWNTYNLLVGVDVASDEVTLVTAPLFHVAALGQTLLPTFIKGGCSVLTGSWDVEACYDLIERHRVTMMFGVPTMFASLAASPRWASADLSSVRTLMCGGASVPLALVRTYQERGLVFCQGYGLTETAPGATFLEAGESLRKAGSAGVAVFFGDAAVDAPPGEPGEVLLKGPNVSPGYWNNPEATAAAWTEDGWFRSGDIATVDAEGHFHVVDRLKDMFVSGGENVYPAEVEAAIFEHPAVAEVAVIGVPDPKWGEVGKAFVVCHAGHEPAGRELREFLLGRIAKYKIPVTVEVVDALPRTGSGKIRKAELRRSAERAQEQ
ncbi:long-chain fatty acid--CoA ligase [Amycolatopsis sp. YIM 10]|uniref:acyl-CoA synthetase n=1 Tax=Amycolatopsis sp. YIM 10 TaxID=2653857 RepID=UPI00128FFED2|nr:long-chain fatty acid--CoA ligase [Amycolatopsis sp. YIM 10]QFU89178.1 Long-chain-fatty-acid--CoA ligase FadD13 [Amycolatopsis sp. YIM 10]